MNYPANEIRWKPGDLVIHDADAKTPEMLMIVVGYTGSGQCQTRYHQPSDRMSKSNKRKVWLNDPKYLHDPARFNIATRSDNAE